MSTRQRIIFTDAQGRKWYGRVVEKTLDRIARDYGIRIPLSVMSIERTKERVKGIYLTLAKTPGLVENLQFIREPKKLRKKKSLYVQTLVDAGVMVRDPRKKAKAAPERVLRFTPAVGRIREAQALIAQAEGLREPAQPAPGHRWWTPAEGQPVQAVPEQPAMPMLDWEGGFIE